MSKKLIAVCEFQNSTKQYEYICEVPEDATLQDLKYKFAVTARLDAEGKLVSVGMEITKSHLELLDIVFIREFKPITDQLYAGTLRRLVHVFGVNDFVEHVRRRKQIDNLKRNLERRLEDLSIFDKIKSLGSTDPTLTSLAEELRKLISED